MKIIAIGDIHGRGIWESIVAKEGDFDKIIFLGDYFDTREGISIEKQMEVFNKIIKFKEENLDKVILLMGNHDFHYTKYVYRSYDNYDYHLALLNQHIIADVLDKNLMQVCFIHENLLFSHAGVTKTWVTNNKIDENDLENSINEHFKQRPISFDFRYGEKLSRTGDDIISSPIWVRIPSLISDGLDGYTHIVGHSIVKNIVITDKIIAIDTLGESGEYLVIENGQKIVKK